MSPLVGLPIFLCVFFWNMKLVTAAFDYGVGRKKQIKLCLLAFPFGWFVLLGESANKLIDKLINKL